MTHFSCNVTLSSSAGAPVVAALRRRGDRVREAEDGLAALGACLKQPPDLIISDVQMPRMDGWQLVRMLRARPTLSRIPLVLLTTLTDDESRLTGYRLGVDEAVNVPVVSVPLRVARAALAALHAHQHPARPTGDADPHRPAGDRRALVPAAHRRDRPDAQWPRR